MELTEREKIGLDFLTAVKTLVEGKCAGIRRSAWPKECISRITYGPSETLVSFDNVICCDWELVDPIENCQLSQTPAVDEEKVRYREALERIAAKCDYPDIDASEALTPSPRYEDVPVSIWSCRKCMLYFETDIKTCECGNHVIELTGIDRREVPRKVKHREEIGEIINTEYGREMCWTRKDSQTPVGAKLFAEWEG